jgi:flagellar protein FliO/FliZ
MLQVLLGLIAVLAAIAAIAWLLKRFVPGQGGAGGMLRVIGGVMVGPKEKVVLVELGETWLLLGVAAGQVNALHSMPKPEGQPVQGAPATPEPGFSAWLHRARRRRKDEA